MRGLDVARVDAKTAIEACTTVQSLPDDHWPDRFFQVTVDQVTRLRRFHHPQPGRRPQLHRRSLPGSLWPLTFPLAGLKSETSLTVHTDYFVLDVRLNGDDAPVTRPFAQAIPLTDDYSAAYPAPRNTHRPSSRPRPSCRRSLAGPHPLRRFHITTIGHPRPSRSCRQHPDRLRRHLRTPFSRKRVSTVGASVRSTLSTVASYLMVGVTTSSPVPISGISRTTSAPSPTKLALQCRRASSQRNKLRAVKRRPSIRSNGPAIWPPPGTSAAEDAAQLLRASARAHHTDSGKSSIRSKAPTLQADLDELDLCESQLNCSRARCPIFP